MATIKNTPRYLNTDSDERVLQTTEMSDALNIRVTAEDNGDSGVVKNVDGNTILGAIGNTTVGSVNKIVGSYEHEGTNRLFVFVHNSLGIHTVYELEQGSSTFTKIIESTNILLSGEPLHINGMMINGDLHLYFTDGVEEPQKLNVDTDLSVGTYPSSITESTVMKALPFAPVTTFGTDETRGNDIVGKSFQFALQYVYRDGEVSAIGEYSENLVAYNTLNNAFGGTSYEKPYNKITIQIGGGTLGLGLGSTIPNLRLYFRDVIDNTMYYVGEYTYTELSTGLDFYNDGSYSIVSDAEYNKLQDAVPRTAQAQTISANRLFYGNYTEGFDKPTTNATLSANISAAPKTPNLPVSITVNDITIDTSNSVDIIDGSSELESVLKFRVQASALNMWGSTSSTHLLTLIDTTDGSVVDTDNVTLTFGIDGFDFFDVNTLTAPTSRNDYATKLANALNGYTMTIGVVPTFLTSATFASTATSIAFVGTAEVSFTASVNASDNVEVAMKVTDLDVTSDRIVQGGANQQGLSVTFAGAITTNAQFGNSSINNDESVTFVQQEFKTFKAGETHSFGIVFEDLYGRSTGVQELGSIKVPTLGERAAGSLGAAHIDITASVSGLDSNLTRFFYVYSGGNTISDYVQYSVSAAFVPEATNISKGNSDSIYVGLRTLQGKDQSYSGGGGADISYTFTEGDKLRILSYLDSSGARVYPDNYTFDVVGLESLDSDIFGSSLNDIEVTGDFLILKDSSQAGFSRAAVVGASDSWGEDVVVEIYTPKKEQTTKIYKAIEGKYDIADLGTTHTITQGNAWFKQRNIKFVDGSDPKKLTNNLMYVESIQYSDYDKNTKGILGGKPYAIINNEREQNRISSITYSDPQLADSAQNNLSSFNNSLANFADYEMNYGGIFGLCDMSDSIMMLQSDKVSRIPVGRQILATGTGSEFVTQSTDILGLQQHYAGNFGINEDRTAFLSDDGTVYLVDVTRSKIVAITQQGVKILNDLGVDSWVNERTISMLEDANGYFVSIGIDKDNDEVYFSLQNLPLSSYSESMVYSKQLDKFTSKSSVAAPYFGTLGLRFFSFRDNDCWEQNVNSTKANFYGVQEESNFKISFNESPSLNKVFNALSIEGTADADVEMTTSNNQNLTILQEAFKLKEGEYYAKVGRSDSDFNKIVVGKIASINGDNVTFLNRVNRIPFKLGGDAFIESVGSYISVVGTSVSGVVDAYTLSFVGASNLSPDQVVAISGEGVVDGEPMRGFYSTAKFTFDDIKDVEVFAVNASVAQSNLHNDNTSQ